MAGQQAEGETRFSALPRRGAGMSRATQACGRRAPRRDGRGGRLSGRLDRFEDLTAVGRASQVRGEDYSRDVRK